MVLPVPPLGMSMEIIGIKTYGFIAPDYYYYSVSFLVRSGESINRIPVNLFLAALSRNSLLIKLCIGFSFILKMSTPAKAFLSSTNLVIVSISLGSLNVVYSDLSLSRQLIKLRIFTSQYFF